MSTVRLPMQSLKLQYYVTHVIINCYYYYYYYYHHHHYHHHRIAIFAHAHTHKRAGTRATKSARSSSSFPTIKRSGTMKLLIINHGSLTITFYRAARNVTFARQIKASPASAISR
jgi:hypothetical protein